MAKRQSWFANNVGAISYWSAQLLGWGLLVGTGVVSLSLPGQAIAVLAALAGSTALATAAATALIAVSIVVLPSLLSYAVLLTVFHGLNDEKRAANENISLAHDTLGYGFMTALLVPFVLMAVLASGPVLWPVILGLSALPFAVMFLRFMVGVMVSAVTCLSTSTSATSSQANDFERELSNLSRDELVERYYANNDPDRQERVAALIQLRKIPPSKVVDGARNLGAKILRVDEPQRKTPAEIEALVRKKMAEQTSALQANHLHAGKTVAGEADSDLDADALFAATAVHVD